MTNVQQLVGDAFSLKTSTEEAIWETYA